MSGFLGSDVLDTIWRVDKYPDMADIVPMHDSREHLMGDECWCSPTVVKPKCGGCGEQHFVIVCHGTMRDLNTAARDSCRDRLTDIIMRAER